MDRFTVVICGQVTKKSSFSKIRVAHINFYRKLLHVQVAAVPVQCLWRITFLILNV